MIAQYLEDHIYDSEKIIQHTELFPKKIKLIGQFNVPFFKKRMKTYGLVFLSRPICETKL